MSGALSAFGPSFVSSLVTGVLTGSTRQIVWPLLDQVGAAIQAFGGDPSQFNVPDFGLIPGISQGIASSLVSGVSGYVAILEEHRDELEITSHPVEQGSTISDHAYKMPATPVMQIGWSTSVSLASAAPSLLGLVGTPITPLDVSSLFTGGGSDIFIRHVYQQFLTLQAQRTLLTVYTGKRIYNNLLIQSLTERTTEQTEHALILSISLKEIVLAKVHSVQVPTNPNSQALPQVSTPSVDRGATQLQPAPNFNLPAGL